jgi:lysophospholipase L1-like esterase
MGLAVHLRFRPRFRVLAHQPHPVAGWTLVPSFTFPSTGAHGEFLVEVTTNRDGFRDRDHQAAKSPGTIRIALLGDSLVEGLQVPFEETAGRVLENELNRRSGGDGPRESWEVHNFGVANYGLGQFLLAWEEFARPTAPDYVVILAAGFHFWRTVERHSTGGYLAGEGGPLWIRPVFALDGEELVRLPAADFGKFLEAQRRASGGTPAGRIRQVTPPVLLRGFLQGRDPDRPTGMMPMDWAEMAAVNLLVLEDLARQVAATGARLLVLNAGGYFKPAAPELTRLVESFAWRHGLGYVDLEGPLREAEELGEEVTWPRDGHFTAAGHRLVAQAIRALVESDRKLPGG